MSAARIIGVLLLLAAGFAGGFTLHRWLPARGSSQAPPVASPAARPERKILYYVDPMHPAYKSGKPGIAPDCGMQLEPVYAEEGSPPPAGVLNISPQRQQLIGVRYGVVEEGAAMNAFRTVGKVALDETRIVRVHSRVDGWIEKVFVDFVGKQVRKGETLLTLYSPELLASQNEFLLALRAGEVLRSATLPSAIENSTTLLDAARRRLELWNMTPAQIDEIARSGKPSAGVAMEAPISGHVMTRNAFPGQRVTAESELYTLADLSRVWIMADVFEFESPEVRIGQHAIVSLPYAGRALPARVSYIQPQMEAETRTLKVRLEMDNPGLVLKPDMFVDVEFRQGGQRRILVPASAVMDTGARQTVFVDRGDGNLEPRPVQTGDRVGDRIVIRSGLQPGERIVISGNFLIDSESQLKSALSGMEPGPSTQEHRHD